MNNKIGIVTLYGLDNYGNRLQNYAVYKIFRDLGYAPETIVCSISRVRNIAKDILRYYYTFIGKPEFQRKTAFYKFVKRTTPVRFVYSKQMRIPLSVADDYLCFFTGSDQVWNPEFRVREKYNFFLQFAPPAKRFCIAPSFGVSAIPGRFVEEYKECLAGINYPSCREVDGARIIRDLTGRDAEILIDPTMMLDLEQWKEIYEQISVPESRYILLYFLGDVSDERKDQIEKIANENNYQIIDVLKGGKPEFKALQPDGLLQLIEHSSFVCTDSFHVAAFSINFNKPFYVFDRCQKEDYGNNMISRISTLLSLFGLKDRLNPTDIKDMFKCDFSYANKVIENERRREKEYLLKCLESCTKNGDIKK